MGTVQNFIKTVRGLGVVPLLPIIFVPRASISFAIVILAQVGIASTAYRKHFHDFAVYASEWVVVDQSL
eukprot:2283389-Pleurochrysis_carterae.AAC.2